MHSTHSIQHRNIYSRKQKTQQSTSRFFIMRRGFAFLSIIIIILVGFFWWNINLTSVNSRDHTEIMFSVSPGSGIKVISQNLKSQGLIRSSLIFTLMTQQSGLDKKIQAGDFRLSPSLSSKEIAIRLSKGIEDIWVTIPEGKRSEEIAAILRDKIPQYDSSWETELIKHEGYLFPDTYLIPHNATIDSIVSLLTSTFTEKYKSVTPNTTDMSESKIVILASLIEREGRLDQDRPLISSVMHNRLQIGMPLQIDATVQYALGEQDNNSWWKKDLTFDDLKINSSYNTYLNPGLPPGPISNPGIKALQAAANPADTNYLYYITDKNGINHYATTLDQHNANIRKYGL